MTASLTHQAELVAELRANLRAAHTVAMKLDQITCGVYGRLAQILIGDSLTMAADLANALEVRIAKEGQ